jgi:HSP20 family molecular chaperone IbpA
MNIPSQPPKDQAMVPNEDDRQALYVAPPADVESTDVGYVIRAEMLGVEKDSLESSPATLEVLEATSPTS